MRDEITVLPAGAAAPGVLAIGAQAGAVPGPAVCRRLAVCWAPVWSAPVRMRAVRMRMVWRRQA